MDLLSSKPVVQQGSFIIRQQAMVFPCCDCKQSTSNDFQLYLCDSCRKTEPRFPIRCTKCINNNDVLYDLIKGHIFIKRIDNINYKCHMCINCKDIYNKKECKMKEKK